MMRSGIVILDFIGAHIIFNFKNVLFSFCTAYWYHLKEAFKQMPVKNCRNSLKALTTPVVGTLNQLQSCNTYCSPSNHGEIYPTGYLL